MLMKLVLPPKHYIILIFLSFFIKTASASDSLQKLKAKVYPLAYYTPETNLAFELFGIIDFRSKGAERNSNIRIVATYTLNKQFFITAPWQIYTQSEKYFHNGRADYRIFPEYFYGLGNNTKEDERELYQFDALTLQNKMLTKVSKTKDNAGFAIQMQQLNREDNPQSRFFQTNNSIIGKDWYRYAALGPTFMRDKRNHILNPGRGHYVDVTSMAGVGLADEEPIQFLINQFDLRKYWELNERTTWANQIVIHHTLGDVPFRALPALGGPELNRGFYQGRFRDKHLFLVQSELRKKIIGRFGFVVFAAAGNVANKFKDLVSATLHSTVGGGLRFRISKNDLTNIRLDASISKDSHAFYLYFAEAF